MNHETGLSPHIIPWHYTYQPCDPAGSALEKGLGSIYVEKTDWPAEKWQMIDIAKTLIAMDTFSDYAIPDACFQMT